MPELFSFIISGETKAKGWERMYGFSQRPGGGRSKKARQIPLIPSGVFG